MGCEQTMRGPHYQKFLEHVELRQKHLKESLQHTFPQTQTITLEIGCGHGHFLTAYAQAFPNEMCVGCDILNDRIARANRKANRLNQNNLRFLTVEIIELLDNLPKHILIEKVFLLFSDPWPKARHHRRRVLSNILLSKLAERATPTAKLYFRTDHKPYYDWAIEHIEVHSRWQLDNKTHWPFEQASIFEKRAEEHYSFIASIVSK